jgi:hypothetical protein
MILYTYLASLMEEGEEETTKEEGCACAGGAWSFHGLVMMVMVMVLMCCVMWVD